MKAYVVTMYRFGDRESHSYVEGVYSKKYAAMKAGEEEREYRGGKYEPAIKEFEVKDKFKTRKTKNGTWRK